jgi:hypothetical protein
MRNLRVAQRDLLIEAITHATGEMPPPDAAVWRAPLTQTRVKMMAMWDDGAQERADQLVPVQRAHPSKARGGRAWPPGWDEAAMYRAAGRTRWDDSGDKLSNVRSSAC